MARKKMWGLLGHSNGEGYAGSSPMLAAAPWLKDSWAAFNYTTTPGQYTPLVARAFHKNIFMWTAKAGWPMAGGTPPSFTPGAGTFLELTTVAPTTPNAQHPYPSPYNYPNTTSLPTTPSFHVASTTGGGAHLGVELPLSYRLGNYWGEPVYIQKLCIPTTFFLRFDQGIVAFGGSALGVDFAARGIETAYSWLTPADRWDWDPGTDRLYSTWISRMTAAAAEVAQTQTDGENDKLDVRFLVLWMGDNDSAAAAGTEFEVSYATSRVREFENHYRAFIRRVRQDLVDNDWTSLPAHKIPIIGMGIFRTYGATVIQNGIADALANIAADDPYFKVVETADSQSLTSAGYTDAVIGTSTHLSHLAYLDLADDIFDAYTEIENLGDDPLANENRVTVDDVMDRVGIYYERNRVRNDATDAALLQHINGAMFHILNRVSDSAWWLRRIYAISISGSTELGVTLPKYVHRILRIEAQDAAGYPLQFEMMGHTDGGRIQIRMIDRFVGTFNVHFITQPKDLSRQSELIPLPYNLVEWLVVEATRRLARSSGNIALQASLQAEAETLAADSMRNLHAVRRTARDRMYGQRRLPDRRSYRRRWWST